MKYQRIQDLRIDSDLSQKQLLFSYTISVYFLYILHSIKYYKEKKHPPDIT